MHDVIVETITRDAIVDCLGDCPSVALNNRTVTSLHDVDYVSMDADVVSDAIGDCPSVAVAVTDKIVALTAIDCIMEEVDVIHAASAKVVIEENAIDITSCVVSGDISDSLGSDFDCAAADVSNMTDEVPYVSGVTAVDTTLGVFNKNAVDGKCGVSPISDSLIIIDDIQPIVNDIGCVNNEVTVCSNNPSVRDADNVIAKDLVVKIKKIRKSRKTIRA